MQNSTYKKKSIIPQNPRINILERDRVRLGRETHPRGARQAEAHWQHWNQGQAGARSLRRSEKNQDSEIF